MAVYNKFNVFTQDCLDAKHTLDGSTDVLKLMLTDTAPTATDTTTGDITEISSGNGYPAGGLTLTYSRSLTGSQVKITVSDTSMTASGGSIGPYRYAVLYNDTSATDPLIGWWDRGSSNTLADGATENFDFDDSNGAFTLG